MKQTWFLALVLAVATPCTPLIAGQGQSAQVLLEAARKAETIDGNPKAAIAQYEQIVKRFASDRAVVADALVRMAGAYKKLGDAQARAIYERVLREYGDQASAASVARAALGTRRAPDAPASPGVTATPLWTGTEAGATGAVSPDGRYLAFTTQNGDLALRDLQSNTTRTLTDKGSWNDSAAFAERSVFSPDGASVAYAWRTGAAKVAYEIHVIDLKSPAGSAPRRLLADAGFPWPYRSTGRPTAAVSRSPRPALAAAVS